MMPREPRKEVKVNMIKRKEEYQSNRYVQEQQLIEMEISLWVLFVMEELQQIKQLASLIIKYVKMLLLCEFT